jgi:hypothetical protein
VLIGVLGNRKRKTRTGNAVDAVHVFDRIGFYREVNQGIRFCGAGSLLTAYFKKSLPAAPRDQQRSPALGEQVKKRGQLAAQRRIH